ncbi:CinA family protein [uncultured Fibrobacter sp.]|uniref:CinA family protein n=2 Tax=Fibrobacter TaxID=832 RepID=UPI001B2078B3|nr:CinA family protein [uncultured Fibrobacter sp.]MBO7060873.1 CinA family protein [Fibrobacter sp.]MBO7104160.1 CinA family protein [Fibrobacter sp.]
MKMNDAKESLESLQAQIHDLAIAIKAALIERGEMMATAESCTGGLVASSIVNEAGSSAILKGGIVAYQNEVKTKLLGVPESTLKEHGAVSAETVEAMAEGALRQFDCQWAVSTSGIAGPGGATPGKPVGTVWMCVANPCKKITFCEIFSGDREKIREKSVYTVLGKLLFALNNQKSTCTKEH